MNVFLGGTCNQSTWRERLIPALEIDYFDPLVNEWNDESYQKELVARETADFCLFVITPKFEGYFALAEVVDTSYKRTDRTIYCFLPEDEGQSFNEQQTSVLENIGQLVEANGALWMRSLAEVISFLKKAAFHDAPEIEDKFYDVFISYGRRHSKEFAIKLREALIQKGYSVWLDKENIAIAVDFQKKIYEGVRHACNFCYVLSPHSVHSEYCFKELNKALELKKKIIPIHHLDMGNNEADIPEVVQRLNWLMFEDKNRFSAAFEQLTNTLEQSKLLMYPHCELLLSASQWQAELKSNDLLLYGNDLDKARLWLKDILQSPELEVSPTSEHTCFINESIYFSQDEWADVCVLYRPGDHALKELLEYRLIHLGFVVCSAPLANSQNSSLKHLIQVKLRKSVNIILLSQLEPTKVELSQSEDWQQVLAQLNKEVKRVFTLLPLAGLTTHWQAKRLIRFDPAKALEDIIPDLAARLLQDQDYLSRRNRYFFRALQWQEKQINAFLLTVNESTKYESFLKLADENSEFQAPPGMRDFIAASRRLHEIDQSAQQNDVYICADSEDQRFCVRLRRRLREFDKRVYYKSAVYHNAINNNTFHSNNGEKIQKSASFEKEIGNASVMLFLLPRTESKAVLQQLKQAESLGKRIVAIKLKRFEQFEYPLAYSQYLPRAFVVDEALEFNFPKILSHLNADLEYINAHRYWLQKSLTWSDKQQAEEFLLGQNEVLLASAWLDASLRSNIQPAPSEMQKQFIARSESHVEFLQLQTKKHQKRLKVLAILSSLLCCISLLLGAKSYLYALGAEEQRQVIALQKKDLEQQVVISKNLAREEKLQRREAEKQQLIAVQQTIEAKNQRAAAEKQKEKAQALALVARQQRNLALENELLAEQNKEEAEKQKQKAQLKEQESNRLKLLAQADSLIYRAKRSEQNQLDLAIQAFNLLKENGGDINNNILFNILYQNKKNNFPLLKKHAASVKYLQYASRDNVLFSADSANNLVCWQVGAINDITPVYSAKLSFAIKQLFFNAFDQTLYLVSKKGDIYRTTSGSDYQLTKVRTVNFAVAAIVAAKANALWLTADRTLYRLNLQSQKLTKEALLFSDSEQVFISPDGQLALVQEQTSLVLWGRTNKKGSGEKTFQRQWQGQYLNKLSHAIFADKQIILFDVQGVFQRYSLDKGLWQLTEKGRAHSHRLIAGQLSPDKQTLVSASLNGNIKLWFFKAKSSMNAPIELNYPQWIHSLALAGINSSEFIFVGTEKGDIAVFPTDINNLLNITQHQSP